MRLACFRAMSTGLERSEYAWWVTSLRDLERKAVSDYLHDFMQDSVPDQIQRLKGGSDFLPLLLRRPLRVSH